MERGNIIYDDFYGHVCTCAGTIVMGFDEDMDYRAIFAEYEPTVKVDRSVEPTESGSYYYRCDICGAGGWSGC